MVGRVVMFGKHLSTLVRSVLEVPALGFLRLWVMKSEAKRERRFVERVASEVGFRFLGDGGEGEFEPSLKKTTLFILGSGSSVELIGDEGFQQIRSGFSIGVNAWPLHTFVPDAYAYEPGNDQQSDYYRTLTLLKRPDVIEKLPPLLILRPRNQLEQSELAQIPEELIAKTFFYGRITPATRKVRNLSGDVRQFLLDARKRGALTVMLDSGATIVRLASLGLLLGFKKIVFVGVDLNDSRYFWEANPDYLTRSGFKSFDSGQRQPIHETMSPENRPFVVTDMLRSLSAVARHDFGAEFFVASDSSALSALMPTYDLADNVTSS